jgi:hypothetical protein
MHPHDTSAAGPPHAAPTDDICSPDPPPVTALGPIGTPAANDARARRAASRRRVSQGALAAALRELRSRRDNQSMR